MGPRVLLTRRVGFSAAHRYYRPDWDEERNRRTFGDNVRLHGHNYVLEATVEGEVDAETGMAADLAQLDAGLQELAKQLGWRDLSEGVDELGGGVPTTENLALLAWRRLQGVAGARARLVRVRLYESPELFVEVLDAEGGRAA